MPSLPDIVERMPPPSRTAVTVAPATGDLEEFVKRPTMVPCDAAIEAVAEPSAHTEVAPTAADAAHQSRLERHPAILMIVTASNNGPNVDSTDFPIYAATHVKPIKI